MNQAHAKFLKVEIECRTYPGFRTAEDKDILANFGNPLPEGTEEARADKSRPKKIAGPMNHLLFGEILHRKVITQVDHFETGPVQTVLLKEMDPGAVSLVVAGDALELKGAAGTGSKDHAGQPMFSHGCRDPIGAARMAGGKNHLRMGHFRPFLGQFQNLSQYPLGSHCAIAGAEKHAQPDGSG